MNFITKKHLPRRTFLRGAGVAIALPLLDSMVPAQTPLARPPRIHAAASDASMCRTAPRWINGRPRPDRQGLRVHRNPQAAREVPRPPASWSVISRTRGRRHRQRCGRRPRALGRRLPQRHPSGEGVDSRRHHDRSDRRRETRTGHAAAVAGSGNRGERAQLRRGLRMRLHQHHFLEHAHGSRCRWSTIRRCSSKSCLAKAAHAERETARKQQARSLLDSVTSEIASLNKNCPLPTARG